MKSGSACRTSTATDSSTRMGQDEPRAVVEQPRCGLGRGDWTVAMLLRDDYATVRLLTSIVARLPGEAPKDRAFEADAGCGQIMPKCRSASSIASRFSGGHGSMSRFRRARFAPRSVGMR